MVFRIAGEIFDCIPDFFVGLIVARGIDNSRGSGSCGIGELLSESIAGAMPLLAGRIKENPAVVPYREAFLKFGINPNKYMCSIEALLSRIQKSGSLPSINAVVDSGNAVSVRYLLPIGAHDIGTFGRSADNPPAEDILSAWNTSASGERGEECRLVEIRRARKGDSFTPFGAPGAEVAAAGSGFEPGEVVYASGPSVRTRRWMWRQSELGKITETTRELFVPIDGFAGFNADRVLAARDELSAILCNRLGATVTLGFVDRNHPEFEG